jgi:hypothetical protein
MTREPSASQTRCVIPAPCTPISTWLRIETRTCRRSLTHGLGARSGLEGDSRYAGGQMGQTRTPRPSSRTSRYFGALEEEYVEGYSKTLYGYSIRGTPGYSRVLTGYYLLNELEREPVDDAHAHVGAQPRCQARGQRRRDLDIYIDLYMNIYIYV